MLRILIGFAGELTKFAVAPERMPASVVPASGRPAGLSQNPTNIPATGRPFMQQTPGNAVRAGNAMMNAAPVQQMSTPAGQKPSWYKPDPGQSFKPATPEATPAQPKRGPAKPAGPMRDRLPGESGIAYGARKFMEGAHNAERKGRAMADKGGVTDRPEELSRAKMQTPPKPAGVMDRPQELSRAKVQPTPKGDLSGAALPTPKLTPPSGAAASQPAGGKQPGAMASKVPGAAPSKVPGAPPQPRPVNMASAKTTAPTSSPTTAPQVKTSALIQQLSRSAGKLVSKGSS